jgi:serine protease Do
MKPLLIICCLFAFAAQTFAETVKDRDGAVRNDRDALKSRTDWIYNDLAAGLAEGKRTGKPLFVTLRCLP